MTVPSADRSVIPSGRRGIALILAGALVCAVHLVIGYLNKRRCVGPVFDELGRSGPDWRIRINHDVCYSDIQQLWLGRDVNLHVFPYLHGGISETGQLTGGAVEFPVLTGLIMWLGGLGADNDGQFLAHSAILLAPFGIATAVMLFALARSRGWWFALAPAVFMYGFFSWDLMPVAFTTAGWMVMIAGRSRFSTRTRAILASVAFGLGAAAKFYPLMFVAPVIAYLLFRRPQPSTDGAPTSSPPRDVRGAILVGATAVGTLALVNLPIAVAGFSGWWASFQFQWSRPIDLTTNSIWFWAGRPFTNSDQSTQHVLAIASTLATATGMFAALVAGYVLMHRRGSSTYPWLQVSAAMLCAYLLFNKVHSPQHILWLLPCFVLLRIRAGWIIAYYCADLAIGIGFFRWQYLIITSQPSGIFDSWPAQAVMVGVWGRAALLIGLAIAFLNARSVERQPPRSAQKSRRVDSAADDTMAGCKLGSGSSSSLLP